MLPIKYGVPRGSILRPILFIININDIFNVSNFLFTILYADDTCVVLRGKSLENLITLMNQELHLRYIWLQSNNLTLNFQKTYYVIFHRARLRLHNATIDLQQCSVLGPRMYCMYTKPVSDIIPTMIGGMV